MKLILFTGPQCHLCELALQEIAKLPEPDIALEKRNIRDNVEDYHRYAVRIPVLKRVDSQEELGWPFTSNDIQQFIS